MSILNKFRIDGQIALVSGASRGIGLAIATALAEAGADVVCAARNATDVSSVAESIGASTGRRTRGFACDISDPAQRRELVEFVNAELGGLNILVNNAGGSPPNDPRSMEAEQFSSVLSWNVVPAYDLSRLCAPYILNSGGGCVINISSAAARYRQKRFSAYGSAKAALNQMTRLLAQDYAPQIRFNAIEPGSVQTQALESFLSADLRKKLVSATPLGRLGSVDDIAAAAVFLAAPSSAWITGKVLEIDGGLEAPAW